MVSPARRRRSGPASGGLTCARISVQYEATETGGAGPADRLGIAAVFIQRLFTSYLPPIWGWATLVWMRKREYL
jgi:hypothetical protein